MGERAAASSSADIMASVSASPQNQTLIKSQITDLEASYDYKPADDDATRFTPLVGLYDVSATLTARPNDNPVGGKWTRSNGIMQKFLRTRRTFQHILPVNDTGRGNLFGQGQKVVGEAVNVISLDALFGWIRIYVILRGDAVPLTLEERTNTTQLKQPLSNLAVKALFDPPRIFFGRRGRLNLKIGPQTSVLLDATYCDPLVRIGMGGTSGTRFVFGRCPGGDTEANEFRGLLLQKPVQKLKALVALGCLTSGGLYVAIAGHASRMLRVLLGGGLSLFSSLLFGLVAFSSGGIEEDDMGVVMRQEGEQKAAAASEGVN